MSITNGYKKVDLHKIGVSIYFIIQRQFILFSIFNRCFKIEHQKLVIQILNVEFKRALSLDKFFIYFIFVSFILKLTKLIKSRCWRSSNCSQYKYHYQYTKVIDPFVEKIILWFNIKVMFSYFSNDIYIWIYVRSNVCAQLWRDYPKFILFCSENCCPKKNVREF